VATVIIIAGLFMSLIFSRRKALPIDTLQLICQIIDIWNDINFE